MGSTQSTWGVYSEDSLEANVVMFRLVFVVAVAAAATNFLEDTTEVALAKAKFQAAFDAAVAGEHAALAPVNNDVQAEQIPDSFLDDAEDVAAAKAEFLAAYEAAAAGGLADLQAPAPVHEIPAAAPAPAPVPAPLYTGNLLPYYPYNHLSAPYVAGYGYPYHGYGYNGLPVFGK